MDMMGQKLFGEEVKRQAEFENTFIQVAQTFLNIPLEALDGAIVHAMKLIAELSHADKAAIYCYDKAGNTAVRQYEWNLTPGRAAGAMPNIMRLPDFETTLAQDTSLCSFPIIASSGITGVLAFSAVGKKEWTEDEIAAIRIFVKILTNILVRKEQETAFREISRNNQIMLDSIDEGVGMFVRDGNTLQVNRHLAERIGRSAEECTGTNIRDFLTEDAYGDLYEKRREMFDEAFSTGRCVIFENTRDGRCFNNRLYPIIKGGSVTAVTLCSLDITDKKTAEAEARRIAVLEKEAELLRKNEANYLEILDGSTEATWIEDIVSGTCEYSEQWLIRIGGQNIPPKDMMSFKKSLIHPDDIQRVHVALRSVHMNKGTKFKIKYRMKVADGSFIWVLDKGKLTYDESGRLFKVYGTSTDITEQKKSEAIILRQNIILKSINMIYEKAMTCENINDLGAACLDIIESITHSKFSFIGEVGKDGLLHAIAIRDPGWDHYELEPTGQKSPLSDFIVNSLYKTIITNGKSLLINDPAMLPDCSGNQEGYPEITSFLGVPFFRDNAVVGLLAAANRTGGFNDDEKELLETITPTVFEVLLRRFAEETVKENEFLMRTIMDSSSDFLFIKDKDSRIVIVNQAYGKVFGVNTNDIIGKNDYDLYHDPELAQRNIESDLHVMETGKTLIYEESAITADGSRTYLMSKEPWHDSNGSILGILGIAHDITELKIAEASLQELVASLKHKKDYINILYETTGKVLSSPTPRQEIQALCVKVMKFLDCHTFFNYLVIGGDPLLHLNACDGVTEEQKRDLELLPLGAAVCGCAIRDGCRIITENIQTTEDPRTEFLKTIGIRAYVCHPLMADGKAIGGLAFGTKSRDQFSDEDLMLMKTLAESVSVAVKRKQNEETLLRQAEELMTADQNKNEFIGTLSHELRNPLATISAGLSLLDMSEDKAQQKKAITIMRRQIEHLCHLVDDLLDITRITRNRIVLKQEPFELNATAQSVMDDMKALFDEKGVLLEKDMLPYSICIKADPVRVRQMIGNLLHNALKFSKPGCVVALSVYIDTQHACIRVKDNGIGIEKDFMPKLFEPFTQADKSIDRRNGGLGLGLSIVRAIAELHGGSVSASSEGPGKGAAFTICLPIQT